METIGNVFNWITKTKLRSFIFGMAALFIFTTIWRLIAGTPLLG